MPLRAADDPLGAEALLAEVNVEHFRRLREAHLRGACLASAPLWIHAFVAGVPGAVVWLAVLAQGYALVMAAAYAVVAAWWGRRSAALLTATAPAEVHAPRGRWQELRSALWSGLAAASIVPWVYAVSGRPWPRALLAGLTALVVSVFMLLVLVETVPELIGSSRGAGRSPGRGTPLRRP